jgi:hypothetical protein
MLHLQVNLSNNFCLHEFIKRCVLGSHIIFITRIRFPQGKSLATVCPQI